MRCRFFCARSGTEGEAACRCGECFAQPAGAVRDCVGVRRGCVGERKCSGSACRCAGASGGLRRGMGGKVGGFNAHSPQQHARTRIYIYVRPVHAVKSGHGAERRPLRAPIAREDFRTRPVRVCIFVPAFTLSPHGLPRPPRSNRPPAAAVIHNRLSTEKLSTSLLAALCKTFSPSRLRTRIIIYRSPVGRSRECPRRCGEEVAPLRPRVPRRRAQGGGGRRQRRTPPRAVPRTFPAYGCAPASLWA